MSTRQQLRILLSFLLLACLSQPVLAGSWHSLAVKSDGTVWAWGDNSCGQLGIEPITKKSTPVQVNGLTGVVAVAEGKVQSLALKSDGTVWSWGDNSCGQLGIGTTTNQSTPVQVNGLTGMVAVAGGYLHSLALKSDGTVWAWGDNDDYQLGIVSTPPPGSPNSNLVESTPVQVKGLTGMVAVARPVGGQ